jgi:hypothetical protein
LFDLGDVQLEEIVQPRDEFLSAIESVNVVHVNRGSLGEVYLDSPMAGDGLFVASGGSI